MTDMRRMTISEYAKHRRCSRQSIYKALETGSVTRESDGSIDVARADQMWLANTMPRLRASDGDDIVLSPEDLERICGG